MEIDVEKIDRDLGKIIRAEIEIDHEKCKDPIDCGLKCLRACPLALFACMPLDATPEHPPTTFKVVPMFRFLCNYCMLCVEVCPEKAISIEQTV